MTFVSITGLVLGQALGHRISDHILGGDIGGGDRAAFNLVADIVVGEVNRYACWRCGSRPIVAHIAGRPLVIDG